jgi:hypothetical protein
MRSLTFCLTFLLLAGSAAAFPQSCPKVSYTTPGATTKAMVATVNCLVSRSTPGRVEPKAAGVLVESFPVIGPQHTRSYRKIVLALLSISTGTESKTALATPENPAASVSGNAGAECKLKINSDNTVDGQCNQTGGSLFVVYSN